MGKRWLQLDEHMAKIRPFLGSEADVFPSYLPVSDIRLATEQTFAAASRVPLSPPLHHWMLFNLLRPYL